MFPGNSECVMLGFMVILICVPEKTTCTEQFLRREYGLAIIADS